MSCELFSIVDCCLLFFACLFCAGLICFGVCYFASSTSFYVCFLCFVVYVLFGYTVTCSLSLPDGPQE